MAPRKNTAAFAANARREVRRSFERLNIFARSRAEAVFHFVAVLEAEVIRALFSAAEAAPASNLAHRRAVEASAFAIPGIYEFCSSASGRVTGVDRQIYFEARELFDFSYAYEQVDFSFKLADKGQLRIFVPNRARRLTFAYADKSADIAETALRGRELEVVFNGEMLNLDLNVQLQIFRTLTEAMRSQVICENGRCEYTLGPNEIEMMRRLGPEMVKSVPVEMDDAAPVGEITFGQLRLFWGALFAITNVHFMAHHLASGGGVATWPFETVVLRKSRRAFTDLISEITGLAEPAVAMIIGWYIYDPRISNRCPILQPFLPLDDDMLCLPMLFVNGNNMERNFFKLMHRHPALRRFAQAVEERKEPVALRGIAGIFPAPTYRTCERVQIPGVTDADLLVYETQSGFLLVVQHKWLAAPETVEESWGNDAKLADGVKQAVEARDAIRARHEIARRALLLPDAEPITRVEAVTVCRGFEHTGFLGSTAVPVITEVSFRALYQEAGKLQALWDMLNSRPDLQRASQRVSEFKWTLKLAGYEFVMPGLKY